MRIKNKVALRNYKQHLAKWNNCADCSISKIAHKKAFCRGEVPCDILGVGEGPGKTEDLEGKPFVGQSGMVLDSWVWAARDFYPTLRFAVTNVVACRPTDRMGGSNRAPTKEEARNCTARLIEMIEIANPKALFLLGKSALQFFHDEIYCIKEEFQEKQIYCFYHPAYILRNGGIGSKLELETRETFIMSVSEVMKKR